jgi:acetoin utilization deacetylase AcuC-like enzyme
MQIFHSETTTARKASAEFHGGRLLPPFESPERVHMILSSLRAREIGDISLPTSHGMGPIRAIHDSGYVDFIEGVWKSWLAAGYEGEAMPFTWPTRHTRAAVPRNVIAQLGYYSFATDTAIEAHTCMAAKASSDVALSALDYVRTTRKSAFGLCRPPGHHASVDQFGGYCFFNNAAIAAQYALSNGSERVAILDIDCHHGNGTQQIFYKRSDVLYVSLHGDPAESFPYFLGYQDERGTESGIEANANYPLPVGTDYRLWSHTLIDSLDRIREYEPDILIVSLGVDAYKDDPIGLFNLNSDDFTDCGGKIAKLGQPTVFLLEGGYAMHEIGTNVSNVLFGFDMARGA